MQRSARMLPVARQIVDVVGRECHLMKRSGIHFVHTAQKDMVMLVHELIKADALTDTPERKYKYYCRFTRSPLMCIQMQRSASGSTNTSMN